MMKIQKVTKVAVVGLTSFMLCSMIGCESKAEQEARIKEEVKEEMQVEQEANEKKVKQEEEKRQKEDKALEMYYAMVEVYEDNENFGEVTYNKERKIFTVQPYDSEMFVLAMFQDEEGMIESFERISQTIYSELGEGYSLRILSPKNEEIVVLNLVDGKLVYNVKDE